MNFRIALSAVTVVACLSHTPIAASAQQAHLEVSNGWARKPVTNGVLDARLRQAAIQYREYAPVPRIALYDLTFPVDSVEAASLNGFGVVVVTAVAQDSAELPLRRVYLRSADRVIALQPLVILRSAVDSAQIEVRATFGTSRYDALFLVPLAPLQSDGAEIFIDFAIRRNGFRIGAIAAEGLPSGLRGYRAPTKAAVPPRDAIRALIAREFPGLPDALGFSAQEP
jgi:hypothetical protein